MVIRNVVKLLIATGEAVGKAFTRAVRDEIKASRQAAERNAAASSSSKSQSDTREEAKANARLGISLQESMQILDVKALDKEELEKRFEHLFNINAKEKGGTLYLQSKVYRAKERLDSEVAILERRAEEKAQKEQEQQ